MNKHITIIISDKEYLINLDLVKHIEYDAETIKFNYVDNEMLCFYFYEGNHIQQIKDGINTVINTNHKVTINIP